MNGGEIDRLQVSELPDRYNLVRSAVYTRMDALGIKAEKIGNKSFVNADQLQLLDELHQFLQSGRSTAEFLEMRGLPKSDDLPSTSSGLSTVQPELLQLFTALVSRIEAPAPQRDPLAYLKDLEAAAQNGWHLRTSEVAELLNLPAAELQQYGDRFSEAGFIFTRVGYRAGGEVAWKVSKPLK